MTDDTDSIWDRMCKVDFGVRIAEDAVDKSLFTKLSTELAGILAWAVRGCLDWQRHGLPAPKAVAAATSRYRGEEDIAGRFLADCCSFHPDARATVKQIVDAAAEWCKANGERDMARKALAERLSREGCFEARTNKARGWRGVRLLEPHEIKARDEAGDEVTRGDADSGVLLTRAGNMAPIPLVTSPPVTLSLLGGGEGDGERFYESSDFVEVPS